jgi:cobyrinic acid a,c-diamide synthase
MTARGLLISAPRSGAGKTTVTLGILKAFSRRGMSVRSAKAGPDYIDGAFHAAATGSSSINLDSWAMPPALIDALVADAAREAEVFVIEGAMGLFDGVPGIPGRSGTAADIAARLKLPVLLVLDVAAQSQSAAAVVRGFATHDPEVRVAGVVLNRVGSARHHQLVADAIAKLGVPVVGAIPRDTSLGLPERHLGLIQAGEHGDLAARLGALADMAETHLDLDAISRRPSVATAAGCPAVTRSCTPGSSHRRGGFTVGLFGLPRRGRSTASAAATWCSAKVSKTPKVSAMP